jgi:7-cyano-7-deazaguanine synthase
MVMTARQPIGIVLVSGGMDSCVTAAIAAEECRPAFLHVNYGQRTEQRELKAFHDIADTYGVTDRLVVSIEHLKIIGGSSLTDHRIEVQAADLHRSKIPTSYVPFRNAHLLSIAVSWAEVIGAERIYIGVVEEDSSGYPDCREEFYRAFNAAIRAGTKPETRIEIYTPIIHLSKADIIRRAISMKAPLHLSWSCYQNEGVACGICDSCALRLRGFRELGIEDPISYIQRPSY